MHLQLELAVLTSPPRRCAVPVNVRPVVFTSLVILFHRPLSLLPSSSAMLPSCAIRRSLRKESDRCALRTLKRSFNALLLGSQHRVVLHSGARFQSPAASLATCFGSAQGSQKRTAGSIMRGFVCISWIMRHTWYLSGLVKGTCSSRVPAVHVAACDVGRDNVAGVR